MAARRRAHEVARVACAHLPVFGDEEISALDVPMADALLVQPLQPAQHLPHVDAHQVLGEGAEVLDERRQGAILHVLEDEVEMAFGADSLKVSDNLRVLEVVQQVNLRLHRLQVPDGHVAGRDLLDGTEIARLPVERAVDFARAAAAELLAQLLRGETQASKASAVREHSIRRWRRLERIRRKRQCARNLQGRIRNRIQCRRERKLRAIGAYFAC